MNRYFVAIPLDKCDIVLLAHFCEPDSVSKTAFDVKSWPAGIRIFYL